jgi:hypothetical protein
MIFPLGKYYNLLKPTFHQGMKLFMNNKMYKTALTLLAVLILFTYALGQHALPVKYDIQRAYDKETRTYDGMPGKNYWQNGADYNIKVFLDTDAKTISGHQRVVYSNNSPDTLSNMVVRLYQDLYKKGNQRDYPLAASDIHNGVNINKISISGINFDPNAATRSGTNMTLPLWPNLNPGEKVEIEISWDYPISQTSTVREGYYSNHDGFFIAYWYPQIAVYDDVWGWNRFNYTGMQEFYNDFNNYRVEISAPRGYVVWATGVLQNPDDNLSPNILEKYRQAQQSDQIISVITKEDYEQGLVTADRDTLTWVYTADNVTDFAFAASDHYMWQASRLKLNNRDVLISAAFDRTSKDFYEVAEVSRESIKFFSEEMPGVEYPYPAMTVFNGKGGMEFPMMVNDGSMPDRALMVYLTSHEIAHTYFPFYMGINEQMFAFMDEGWAMMLPFELQLRLAPSFDPISRTVRLYEFSAVSSLESQLMLPSIALSGHVYSEAYRNSAYSKSGLAYYYLVDVLGEELFKKALHEYMRRWNGKHPLPYDFFYTFNDVAGEDLSWYWMPWFFETGYPDLALSSVTSERNRHEIVISNNGNIPVPVHIQVYFTDGTSETIKESARVWEKGKVTHEFSLTSRKTISSVVLGNAHIPDVNKNNNTWDMETLPSE